MEERITIPSLTTLQHVTEKLENTYLFHAGVYVAPDYAKLRERIILGDSVFLGGLRTDYENRVPKKKPGFIKSFISNNTPTDNRLEQIHFITSVCNALPESPKLEETSYCYAVLKGCLAYRFTRLLNEYAGNIPKARKECALFASLEQLMNIDQQNPLDHWSIHKTCTAFQKFCKENTKLFAFIEKDKEFFKKLNDITEKAKNKSTENLPTQDLPHIHFIVSIAKLLRDLEQSIQHVSMSLQNLTDHKENDNLLEYIQRYAQTAILPTKNAQAYQTLCMHFMRSTLAGLSSLFQQKKTASWQEIALMLQRANCVKSQYILLGAYQYVLQHKTSSLVLKKTIHTLLHEQLSQRRDQKIENLSLQALQQCSALPEASTFIKPPHCRDYKLFEKDLAQVLLSIQNHHTDHRYEMHL